LVAPDLTVDFPPLKTLDRPRHNLPAQPTTLIGREQEIAAVCAMLRKPDVRLITLTGPGGTGKTRLALQVAAELLDEPGLPFDKLTNRRDEGFADGVYFVALAPISDPALVLSAIVQTLGVRESGGTTLLDGLKEYLREKRLLLVLDNFEQVVAAAPFIAALLAAAPHVKVLVTSRAALHLSGEREVAVPPLALPDRTRLPSLERLTQYEAVRLFIERAQAVKADFAVTNDNAPAVAEICYRLDGLPLAIELAAARSKLFAPQALLARLDQRLKLLTGGARDLPARQQTLRSAIAWSYDLLDAAEQALFARLGVFVGGWTLEAAEEVLRTEGRGLSDSTMDSVLSTRPSVLDGLAALLDQSLVRQEAGHDGEPRFTMLKTIREYALEQLIARGQADALRRQHADYFRGLAEQAEPWIRFARPERDPWIARLDAEHDNLRAALEWLGQREEAELGLRLAWTLRAFWQQRGHWSEGRAWLEATLAQSGTISEAVRAKALVTAGHLAWSQGDLATARAYIEEGLALLRGLGDKAASATALWLLGNTVIGTGEYAMARACAEECLALFDAVNDLWGRAFALELLGHIAAVQGDLTQAAIYNEEILAFYRQSGYKRGIGIALLDKGVTAQLQGDWENAVVFGAEGLAIMREAGDKEMTALALHNLGGAVLHQGDARRAAACFAEGLALSRELQAQYNIAMNLAGMAGAAAALGLSERSAQLFGAAEALFDAMGQVVEPADRAEYDRNAAVARAQLGDTAFAAAWDAGRAMPLEQAIAEALELTPEVTPPTLPATPPTHSLDKRLPGRPD
jgi:predicted ATPase